MKISAATIPVAITVLFAVFIGGFYLGRISTGVSVEVSAYADPDTASGDSAQPDTPSADKVNINTATLDRLCTLDGINNTLAQRIIDYRECFGPFQRLAQLTEVDGIGQNLLDKIIDRITI